MSRKIIIFMIFLFMTMHLFSQTAPIKNIYFTFQDDLQSKFIQFIDTAAFTIEMAFYDIELKDVGDKLIEKHNLGIAVKVVTDDNQAGSSSQVDELRAAGITVIEGEANALMHNKFCVVDERYVWTGSWNATYNGTFLNNNNAVIIDDLTIAENYVTEFNEMYKDSDFSASSPANTPHPLRVVNGMSMETYFAPEDEVMENLIPHVNDAASSIYFMAFSLSHDDLANSLINRYRAGVTVRGILEQDQMTSANSTSFDELSRAGVDVHADTNPFNMHHKVMIIDGKVLVFGSFNFSNNADNSNDENLMVIKEHGTDNIASQYKTEFDRVWAEALSMYSLRGHISISTESNSYLSNALVNIVGESVELYSDDYGWYRFDKVNFPAFGSIVKVNHPDCYSSEKLADSSTGRLDFIMDPLKNYGSVIGKVLDGNNVPLKDVNVEIRHRKFSDNVYSTYRTFSDVNGQYKFFKIPDPNKPLIGELFFRYYKTGYDTVNMNNMVVITGGTLEVPDVQLGKIFKVAAVSNPFLEGYVTVIVYAPGKSITETPVITITQNNYIPRTLENVVSTADQIWTGAYKVISGYSGLAVVSVNSGSASASFYIRELIAREDSEVSIGSSSKVSAKIDSDQTGLYLIANKVDREYRQFSSYLLRENAKSALVFQPVSDILYFGLVGKAKKPVQYKVSFNDSGFPSGKTSIYRRSEDNNWLVVKTEYDKKNRVFFAKTDAEGYYALFVDDVPPSAELKEGILVVEDAQSGLDHVNCFFNYGSARFEIPGKTLDVNEFLRKEAVPVDPECGDLVIQLTDNSGNRSEKSFPFQYKVSKAGLIDEIVYFPNPVTGNLLTVKVKPVTTSNLYIEIYDFNGDFVKQLADGTLMIGGAYNVLTWDAKNDFGQDVANGTYFMKIKLITTSDDSDERKTIRITVLKD